MLIDIHVQTRATVADGHDPARIIDAAKKAGLSGVAFVERLQSSHSKALLEAGEQGDFPVFIGVEIPTTMGRYLCFAPELDPFMSREEWRQLMAVGLQPPAERVIELFESIGGAVLAGQPYARENGIRLGDNLVYIDGLHGVEALTPAAERADCRLAIEAGVRLGLPLAGGSGLSSSLNDLGKAATLFVDVVSTQAELVEALRNGNFWAVEMGSSGAKPRRPRGDSRRRQSSAGDKRGRGRRRRRGGQSSRGNKD